MKRFLFNGFRSKVLKVMIIACLLLSTGQIGFSKTLYWYEIQTDNKGKILPWYSPNLGESYDHVIKLVFDFWINMRKCPNGIPYYMPYGRFITSG